MALVASSLSLMNPDGLAFSHSEYITQGNEFRIAQASDGAVLLEQGTSQFDAGDYGNAIETYSNLIETSAPNSQIAIQARLRRSRAYVLATVFGSPGYDNYDQAIGAAIADCSRVIALEPENPAGHYCRGFAYFYLGSQPEAFTDFNRALELAPNDSQAYYERGYAYYLANEWQQAVLDLSQAIELAPEFASAYFIRGTIHESSEPQKALEDFNQAIELDPAEVQYYRARGHVRNHLRDYQGAIEDFTEVIEIAPSGNAYSDRGFALAALGRYREAIADYDLAISLVPKHISAHYGRGIARADLGDREGAMSDLQTAEKNYREGMGEGNLEQPLYQQILQAIEQLR